MIMRKIVFIISLLSIHITTSFSQTLESDLLFGKGVDLYNKSKYNEAIIYFEQSQELDKNDPDMLEERRYYNETWIANCYYKLGNINKAEQIVGRDYHLDPIDRRLTRQSDSLVVEAQMAANAGNFFRAIYTMSDIIKLESKNIGENSDFVANSILYKSEYMFADGDVENALKEIDKGLLIYTSNEKFANSYVYGCALIKKSSFLFYIGQYEEAKKIALDGLALISRWNLALDIDLADAYYILASCESAGKVTEKAWDYTEKLSDCLNRMPAENCIFYLDQFQFCCNALIFYLKAEDALKLANRYLDIVKDNPDYNQAYCSMLYTRSIANNTIHQHQDALADIQMAIEGLEKDFSVDKNYLDDLYLQLGEVLCSLNCFDEAIKAANEALKRSKNRQDDRTLLTVNSNRLIAVCYNAQSKGSLAYKTINEALKLIFRTNGTNSKTYADLLVDKAKIASGLSKVDESINLLEQAADIYMAIGDPQQCAYTLYSAACVFSSLGKNLRKAIDLTLKALKINGENLAANKDISHVELLYSLGNLYSNVGNKQKAVQYYNEAITECRDFGITGNLTYARVLLSESLVLSSEGNFYESERLLNECLDLTVQISGSRSALSNEIRTYLAQIQYQNGNKDLAKRTMLEIEILSKDGDLLINGLGLQAYLGLLDKYGEHDRIINIYNQIQPVIKKYALSQDQISLFDFFLAGAYGSKGEWDLCAKNIIKPFDAVSGIIRNNFLTMSSEERNNLWSSVSIFFSTFLPSFCQLAPNNSLFTSLAYNGALMNKGILLQTESSLIDIIEKKGSSELKDLYKLLISKRDLLFQLKNQPQFGTNDHAEELRKARIDSLQNEVESLEHRVTSKASSEIGDFTAFLDIKWTDVKKRLNKDEIAVEFVRFMEDGDFYYGALVVNKDSKEPRFIKLASEQTLQQNQDNKNLSEFVWRPIIETFNQNTIYFSPDGLLYSLPIESAQDLNSDRLLSERKKLFRLSSTRELVLNQRKSHNQAAVYGGMLYNLSSNELIADTLKYKTNRTRSFTNSPLLRDDRESESFLPDLPGTKIEAEAIYENLINVVYNTSLYEGKNATELSLKALSGSNLGILHIGTHGFYESAMSNNSTVNILQNANQESEDMALSRSGLFFSGCQNYLSGNSLPEGVDDGVLTALEISQLDFRNLDLVSLSACQTGQGDISSEGVFGLQRGFKKSGANSILMSLWSVDDDATQLLMTEFYKQLISGNSKHSSLEIAKQKVRSQDKWKDPKYWAAFILLDAIN